MWRLIKNPGNGEFPAVSDHPGAFESPVSFTSNLNDGISYFYGGNGWSEDINPWERCDFDVLWRLNLTNANFEVVHGSVSVCGKEQKIINKTIGFYAPIVHPGPISRGGGWRYSPDVLYLFGGYSSNTYLTGLWSYSNTLDLWSFAGGTNETNEETRLVAKDTCGSAIDYYPGSRYNFAVWIAPAYTNRLYLYGGLGFDDLGEVTDLGDMWYYDVGTEEFCFLGPERVDWNGNYVNKGEYSPFALPQSRSNPQYFTRKSTDELCIFGGRHMCDISDFWCYDATTGLWLWISGMQQNELYGEFTNYFSSEALPPSREFGKTVMIGEDLVYLFGGNGWFHPNCGSVRYQDNCVGILSDLWVFSFSLEGWKIISPLSTWDINQGEFGASTSYESTNWPNARQNFIMETTLDDTIILGFGRHVSFSYPYLSSDLESREIWEYDPNFSPPVLPETVPVCNGVMGNESTVCGGFGYCESSGLCSCPIGRGGPDCAELICWSEWDPIIRCGGPEQGTCTQVDQCECTSDYSGLDCQLNGDLSFIKCVDKCDGDVENRKNFLMVIGSSPNEFSSENFMGSRATRAVFQGKSDNENIFFFGGGDPACSTVDCTSVNHYNDMWVRRIGNDGSTEWKIHPTAGNSPINVENGIKLMGNYEIRMEYADGIFPSVRNAYISALDDEQPESTEYFIFGGECSIGHLYDLWSFDVKIEQWKLHNGPNTTDNNQCEYPTQRNVYENGAKLGGRETNGIWYRAGEVFIFGGWGNSHCTSCAFWQNDMWVYSVDESLWKFTKGSQNGGDYGVYGNKGSYHADSVPSARSGLSYWKLKEELFLFGGNFENGRVNDLFKYNASSHIYCWIGGYNRNDISYDTRYSVAYSNDFNDLNWPGGRMSSGLFSMEVIYDDEKETLFFLLGGNGYSLFNGMTSEGFLNDMWIFSPRRGQFRWLYGDNGVNANGNYIGSLKSTFPISQSNQAVVRTNCSYLLVFSGSRNLWGNDEVFSDVWKVNLESLEMKPLCVDHENIINPNQMEWLMFVLIFSGIVILVLFLLPFVVLIIILAGCGVKIIVKRGKKDRIKKIKKAGEIGLDDITLGGNDIESDINMNKLINSKLFEIDYSTLKLEKQIGTGGSNCVIYLADWNHGTKVAVKIFKTGSLSDKNDFEDFEKETKVISSINHPSIISFYGATIKIPKIGIVLEYCSKGDLRSYILKGIRKGNFLSKKQKYKILFEISSGMEYLHDRLIIHRDLKCSNVLLTDELKAKIIDFGLSRLIRKGDRDKTRRVGTSYYMAPEMLTSTSYSNSVDVFSFGIMLFEILENNLEPYGREMSTFSGLEMKVAMNPNFRPEMKDEKIHDENVVKLMKTCWSHGPGDRPSFKKIKTVLKPLIEKEE